MKINKLVLPLIFALSLIFTGGCDEDNTFSVDFSTVPEPFNISGAEKTVSDKGLIIYIIKRGSGPFSVNRRDAVSLFYTGRKQSNLEVFDSSYSNGETDPAIFDNLGTLVEGFRDGLLGMKPGGKRVLIIPPSLGYGNSGPSDLRNDTLRFDIELHKILD